MKILKCFIKIIGAGLLAIGILSLLMCVYSLLPAHVENPDGNTDYVWSPDGIWMKMTEGISWGKFDARGYNNAEAIEDPDIVAVGSSQVEATNVLQEQNFVSLLNDKFDGTYSVYNMGISAHNFFKTCWYLPQTLEAFETTPKVIIMETDTLLITSKRAKLATVKGFRKKGLPASGAVGVLQQIPFLRRLNQQEESGLVQLFLPDTEENSKTETSDEDTQTAGDSAGETAEETQTAETSADEASGEKVQTVGDSAGETAEETQTAGDPADEVSAENVQTDGDSAAETSGSATGSSGKLSRKAYNRVFKYLASLEKTYNTQIVIFYHPTGTLQEDGSIQFPDSRSKEMFSDTAEKYDITFVDMTDAFETMYETEHHVAHGFVTGELESGHLNVYGHAAIAEELYTTLQNMAENGELDADR